MTALSEMASLIRSKNAGPFSLTFDLMFSNEDVYRRVKDSGRLSVATFCALFRCDPEGVKFFECDNALAFKFTMPRPRIQGSLGDADLHGGQQFAPLMDIDIP